MSNLKETIETSFTQYSGAVLQNRALVDVRDCLKPSARQIFYCMKTDNFIYKKPYQKTLKAIGSASLLDNMKYPPPGHIITIGLSFIWTPSE